MQSGEMSGVSSTSMPVCMPMCEFVCERKSERHCLAVVVDNVMLVPLEREPQTQHSSCFSLIMSEMNGMSFMSQAPWTAAGEVSAHSVSLAPTISGWRCFPSPFGTRTFSMCFDLWPSFRHSFALKSLPSSLSESASLSTSRTI